MFINLEPWLKRKVWMNTATLNGTQIRVIHKDAKGNEIPKDSQIIASSHEYFADIITSNMTASIKFSTEKEAEQFLLDHIINA